MLSKASISSFFVSIAVMLKKGPPQRLKLALGLENQNRAINRDTKTVTRMNRAITHTLYLRENPPALERVSFVI